MSIVPSGILGAIPGQAAADHARRTESNARASDAAGIGRTDAEEQTGDRDADGRRLWERKSASPPTDSPDEPPLDASRQSLDATGHAGTRLDLTG